MSDALLPPGITIGSGRDPDERPVVVGRVQLPGERDPLTVVVEPHEAPSLAAWLARQPDRRVRALGALILRQARLIESAERARGTFPRLVSR